MGMTAGRDLLARHIDCPGICDVWVERDAILAIERQARDAALAELRRELEGLPDISCHRWHEHTDKAQSNVGVSRAAVLAAIARLEEPR